MTRYHFFFFVLNFFPTVISSVYTEGIFPSVKSLENLPTKIFPWYFCLYLLIFCSVRRKCASGCIFAPYFCSEQGAARFAAIHKVFGASNVSKLLLHVPVADRYEAVVTIAYEAQARIRDPVYGCVAHISLVSIT